ncbi:MAG: hypothetical protein IJ165_13260 [Proteobacteria bacterium]|nr:hypothetical protein [Pseudomonadota bacterium]
MSENSKRRLAFACCAALALGFAGCGDDSSGASGSKNKCGDSVCTDAEECVNGKCEPKDVGDPCDKCGTDQTCEDGVCKDKPIDDPCAKCGTDQTCEDGVCKDKPIENPCPECTDGKVCDPATKTCIDPPEDPCSLCTDKQECVNLTCVDIDPCANKTCPDNTRCDREKDGECVDIDPCEGITCGDAQTCIKAHCIDDACIEDGAEKDCGEGKTCSKGECVDDGCQDKTCNEGYQCIKGLCEETACIDYFCEEGRTCKGGKCVDNECLDMACDEGMICSKGNCTYEICLDKDPCSTGKFCNAEGNCEFITAPAIALDEPEDKASDESGKTVSLQLRLNNAPTADVHITCEVITESQNKEVETACDDILFNAENWQLEQTILVTGVDDYLKDGDQTYQIKVTTVSEDPDFNELSAESVELTNIDTTKPGFIFSETAITTYEDQESPAATFTIQLSSIPASDVRLTLSTSNDKEGTVSPTTVIFTKDNWGEPQTITVQGVDDEIRDGNINYTIFFSPSESNDEDYNGTMLNPIKATNIDNDHAGLNVNIPAEDFELHEGQNRPVLIKLNTQPKKDVKVTLAVDDDTEAKFDVSEVTLNAENWKTGVEVNLTGISDFFIDGDQPIKLTFTTSSEDEDYNLEPLQIDGKVIDEDTADVLVAMGDSPIVKEGSNDSVTMSVSLTSKPTKEVTLALSITDDTELKINKKSLTIKPEHWDIPQDILVNSVDDDIVDGNIKSKVVIKMSSGDTNFNDKTKEVEFTTVDNDVAGFLINSNAASFPEGSGSTTSMKVSLQSQPTADVKVTVSSTDASELMVSSATTLTFTTSNWKTPQEVSAKVVDDKIADGTQTAQIKFVAASTDTNFDKIEGYSAVYTITDDDAPSVVLTAKNSTISQAAPNTTATIVLGIQPSSNVTVSLTSDLKAISFSKSQLTFTPSNWNTEQTVTVNVDFNAIATASAKATLTAKATGTGYNVTSTPVVLNLVKIDEVQNFAYTGKVQTTTLPRGTYKLEVWGANGGDYQDKGGRGGYVAGTVDIADTTTVYVYVGGAGTNYTGQLNNKHGGFNGGGNQVTGDGYSNFIGGGGGATDMRLGTDSLYARVIVAGGGGGVSDRTSTGGAGGGASGVSATGSEGTFGGGGTVSSGGSGYEKGSFGLGGTGFGHGGGGGGGWYGGGGGAHCGGNAGGGSGWIHTAANYTNWKAGNATDANKYLLNNVSYMSVIQNTPGTGSIPAPAGGTETGHTGNGYARISLVK